MCKLVFFFLAPRAYVGGDVPPFGFCGCNAFPWGVVVVVVWLLVCFLCLRLLLWVGVGGLDWWVECRMRGEEIILPGIGACAEVEEFLRRGSSISFAVCLLSLVLQHVQETFFGGREGGNRWPLTLVSSRLREVERAGSLVGWSSYPLLWCDRVLLMCCGVGSNHAGKYICFTLQSLSVLRHDRGSIHGGTFMCYMNCCRDAMRYSFDVEIASQIL